MNPLATPKDPDVAALKVYWQPGCSSCLRTKEFLKSHGVAFVSVNVLESDTGFRELAELGLRRVPIVRRAGEWVDGQVIADVARIAGIAMKANPLLPPDALVERGDAVMRCAMRLAASIPEDKLDTCFPGRPRSYRQITAHIVQIFEIYLDLVERGQRAEHADYEQDVPEHVIDRGGLVAYGEAIRERFARWWSERGRQVDYQARADVYYGVQTLQEFLERTVWHAGQHTRQLQLAVESLGLRLDPPLTESDFAGLPMPENVYDDQIKFA